MDENKNLNNNPPEQESYEPTPAEQTPGRQEASAPQNAAEENVSPAAEETAPSGQQRNTKAPSGWTYSANTNQYVSWDDSNEQDPGGPWQPGSNPGASAGNPASSAGNPQGNWQPQNPQQAGPQVPPRPQYGTQYGYYNTEPGPQQPHRSQYQATGPYVRPNDSYQWDFAKYESADQNSAGKKKSKSGRGFKVFLGLVAGVLSICLIAMASFGVYELVGNDFLGLDSVLSGEETSGAGNTLGGAQNSEDSKASADTPSISLAEKPEDNSTVSTDGKLTATEIYSKVSPSIVGVVQYRYSTSIEAAGEGSGIIISKDGYILTNAHVVEGADAIKVVLYNNEEYEAEIVGKDTRTDIAVLKIDADNLTPAELGDSAGVEVGETVYAIGNPGGLTLQSSFTGGMISGVNRVITTSESSYSMTVLQTDAAINPGNSGGALVNEYGQVIGITNSKLISTSYEGIGFAIPTAEALPVMQDLMTYGYVSGRPIIGVTVQTIDSVAAEYYNVPQGAQIITITDDSPLIGTEAAVGDIITKFDDTEITSVEDLQNALSNFAPGDKVTLTLYRYSATGKNDKSFTVEVALQESHG